MEIFFKKLHAAFAEMLCTLTINKSVNLQHILADLKLNKSKTRDLIHQVYLEQWAIQREVETSLYGQLTVVAKFDKNSLKVKVLNARNLNPLDSNVKCNPYLVVRLLSQDKHKDIVKLKTKTKTDNKFPLFDEIFFM